MKFLWFNVETKKELRAQIKELKEQVAAANRQLTYRNIELNAVETSLQDMMLEFPLKVGATVYDIQLRGENGRYTRTKASREHSLINEVIVTTRNYFKLKTRMLKYDVFKTREEAEKYLDNVCIR